MNTLVTAMQHLSQPCGPLPVKDCRVRRFIWLTIYSQANSTDTESISKISDSTE